jgi:hypothetical protein
VTYAPLFFYVFSSSGLGGLVSSLFETNSPFHGGLVALLRSVAKNFWFLLMEIGGNPFIQKKNYLPQLPRIPTLLHHKRFP